MDKEKRAAADAAKETATAARAAASAKPDDAALQKAAADAEANAATLEAAATAPSHEPKPGDLSKKDKIKKRMEILREQYITEGGDPNEFDAEQDVRAEGGDDDATPLTRGDLSKLGLVKSAEQLAGEITDPELRQAVQAELAFVSTKVPAQERYQKALSLASSSKNARIASEATRMRSRVVQTHGSGGAPGGHDDGQFTPTPMEQTYMTKFKLTKEDILASRKQTSGGAFGKN